MMTLAILIVFLSVFLSSSFNIIGAIGALAGPILGGLAGGLFGQKGASRGAARAERQTEAAEQRAFERFQQLRDIHSQDFEETFARVAALRNPVLAQLHGEFEAAPQAAAGRRLASAGALARTAGGPRSGQAFGLARADIARRLQAEAGLEASILRLQGLQGRTGLAQLEEAGLARQANLLGQREQIRGGLATTLLAGQAGLGSAQIGATGQISAQGVQTGGTLSPLLAQGISGFIGG